MITFTGYLTGAAEKAFVKRQRKTIRNAAKKIGRVYIFGQIEDFAYGGIYEFSSFYTRSFLRGYRG